ncbi:MAG: hypothetical protein OXI48_02740 [bacterium]|nr:hypothetical protein [bacterium]
MTAVSDYFRTALVIDDRVQGDYGPLEELSTDEPFDPDGEPQPGLDPRGATTRHRSTRQSSSARSSTKGSCAACSSRTSKIPISWLWPAGDLKFLTC